MSDNAAIQSKTELDVFRAFAKLQRLPIEMESIEKREPPEPDIRCNLKDNGPVTFEMVEILDQNRVARPFAIQVKVEDTFINELDALSEDKQKRIKSGLSNATINVRINQVISTVKRTELIRKILEELTNIDAAFEGEFQLSEKLSSFAKLDVSRGNFEGPRFKTYSAGHYNPIPLDAITRKLTRRDYKVDCPADLLAFFDTQHAPLEEQIERIRNEIRKQVEQSIFRKVWIYDARRHELCALLEVKRD